MAGPYEEKPSIISLGPEKNRIRISFISCEAGSCWLACRKNVL